jgi:hypothetical protein
MSMKKLLVVFGCLAAFGFPFGIAYAAVQHHDPAPPAGASALGDGGYVDRLIFADSTKGKARHDLRDRHVRQAAQVEMKQKSKDKAVPSAPAPAPATVAAPSTADDDPCWDDRPPDNPTIDDDDDDDGDGGDCGDREGDD